jgi:hypothetical protein
MSGSANVNATFLTVPATVAPGFRPRTATTSTTHPADYLLTSSRRVSCKSYQIRKTLYEHSVKKDGRASNHDDRNQLFLFSKTKGIVGKKNLPGILQCPCILCEKYEGNALKSDEEKVEAILASPTLRTKITILLSMGACFSIQAFLDNGLMKEDREIDDLDFVRSSTDSLFRDLKSGLFKDNKLGSGYQDLKQFHEKTIENLQDDLCKAYKYTSNIFKSPVMGTETWTTLPPEVNLPFIKEEPFDKTRAYWLHIKKLEIHPEYLAKRIKVRRSSISPWAQTELKT